MSKHTAMKPPAPHANEYRFLVANVGLNALSWGIAIPILPEIILDITDEPAGSEAILLGWLIAVFSLGQLLASPILGRLSDVVGRKTVLLASAAGKCIDFSIMALAATVPWLFVARLFGGITAGGWAAASAYVVDITVAEDRARKLGGLNAAFGVGLLVGPVVGGLLGIIDVRLPMWAGSFCALTNFLFGLLVLPSRKPLRISDDGPEKKLFALGSLWTQVNERGILVILAITLLFCVSEQSIYSVFIPYLIQVHESTPLISGSLVAGISFFVILFQITAIRPLQKASGPVGALSAALVANTAGFLVLSLSSSIWVVALALPLLGFGNLFLPIAAALLSERARSSEVGLVMGISNATNSIAQISAPLAYGLLFAWTMAGIDRLLPPASPFILSAVVSLLALIFLLASRSILRDQPCHRDDAVRKEN